MSSPTPLSSSLQSKKPICSRRKVSPLSIKVVSVLTEDATQCRSSAQRTSATPSSSDDGQSLVLTPNHRFHNPISPAMPVTTFISKFVRSGQSSSAHTPDAKSSPTSFEDMRFAAPQFFSHLEKETVDDNGPYPLDAWNDALFELSIRIPKLFTPTPLSHFSDSEEESDISDSDSSSDDEVYEGIPTFSYSGQDFPVTGP